MSTYSTLLLLYTAAQYTVLWTELWNVQYFWISNVLFGTMIRATYDDLQVPRFVICKARNRD